MRRGVFCLLVFFCVLRTTPHAQTRALNAAEVEAATHLGVNGEPAGYPLYRNATHRPNEIPVAYAYTPFVRVALAAHAMLHDKGTMPRVSDVAAYGEEDAVYVGLLDFAYMDHDTRWFRAATTRHEVVSRLLGQVTPGWRLPDGGITAVWASWSLPHLSRGSLDYPFLKSPIVVAAFSRDTLAQGGHVVGEVLATAPDGTPGHMVVSAFVHPGDAKRWR